MRYLFFILFILHLPFIYAQVDETWSEEIKYNSNVLKTIPKDEHSYFVITAVNSSLKDLRIHHFSYGKLLYEELLAPRVNSVISRIEDVFIVDQQLYLFFSEENTSGNTLYAQSINEQCQLVGAPILLQEQEIKGGLTSKEISYAISISPNRQFLSVSYLFNNNNVFEFPDLITSIYDHQLKLLTQDKVKTESYLSRTSIEAIRMTNKGVVMTLIQDYKTPSSSKLKFNTLNLYKTDTAKVSDHIVLESGEYSFFNPIFSTPNDSLYMIAYQYNTIGKWSVNEGAKGVMFYQYAVVTDSLSERNEIEFNKLELPKRLSVKERKKYNKALAKGRDYNLALFRCKLRELTPLEDGSLLITLEENWNETRYYYSGRLETSYTVYNYNSILVMKYDAQLVSDYEISIPKFQISRDDNGYYSSFFQHFSPSGQLYLMFNDNLNNYSVIGEYLTNQQPYNFSLNSNKFCTALVQIDIATGNYNRKTLFDKNDIDNLLVPRLFEIDQYFKTNILTFNRRNRFRFAKMNFQ